MAWHMIGVKELIKVKVEHMNPEIVELYVGDDSDQYYAKNWHKYSDTMEYPSLVIEDKDNLSAVDFRFAFKSTVFIRGNDVDRMIKVYKLVNKCNPKRVFIFHNDKSQTEIIDSKGLLSGIID
jgi:hypothetical protein